MGVQIVHSFTSPSVERWDSGTLADRSDYLPAGDGATLAGVFAAMRPSLYVCSRGDLWPEVACAATECGVPTAIISATVRPSSRRLRVPARPALKPVYERVAWLGAASAGDASRWARLGVPEQSIVVTGDTRHDQVLERITRLRLVRPLLEWARGQTALVAGSTDRCDARLLLDAFSQVRAYHADARLILVPHDCSEGRIAQVIAIADQACVRTEVWDGGIPKPETHCLVVNAMGMLADIYAVGHMAYVGGGFVRGGLHAVVEPAALGLPVIVGPLYESGVDASLLVELGGAVALPRRAADNTMLLTWRNWIDEPNARNAAGLNARRALRQGAATTTVTALLELLGRDPRLLWNARIVKEAPL